MCTLITVPIEVLVCIESTSRCNETTLGGNRIVSFFLLWLHLVKLRVREKQECSDGF